MPNQRYPIQSNTDQVSVDNADAVLFSNGGKQVITDAFLTYDGNTLKVNLVDNWGGLHIIGRSSGEASISLHPSNVGNGDAGQWVLATNGSNLANTEDFAIYNAGSGSQPIYVIQSSNKVLINTNTDDGLSSALQVDGAISSSGPSLNNSTVTTLSGSSSGHIYWSQPEQGPASKKVIVVFAASTDAGQTINFSTAFSYAPFLNASAATLAALAGYTLTTNHLVIPATTSFTGTLTIEGI